MLRERKLEAIREQLNRHTCYKHIIGRRCVVGKCQNSIVRWCRHCLRIHLKRRRDYEIFGEIDQCDS